MRREDIRMQRAVKLAMALLETKTVTSIAPGGGDEGLFIDVDGERIYMRDHYADKQIDKLESRLKAAIYPAQTYIIGQGAFL